MRALQTSDSFDTARRSAGSAQRKGGTAAREHYIGCDTHQRYSVFVTMDEKGKAGTPVRVDHNGEKRDLTKYLKTLPAGAFGS